MSAGWAALAGAMFLGKRKIKKSNPARITYVTWNWIWIIVWFWLQCLHLRQMVLQYALGTTTVAAAAAEWL
jgi:Amt family ammonium transporter